MVLTFERWPHIVEGHDSLHRRNSEVRQAVADPEDRIEGRKHATKSDAKMPVEPLRRSRERHAGG